MMVNTVDVVRACQVNVSQDVDTHRARVGRVIGVRVRSAEMSAVVARAKELGCTLFVSRAKVFKQFKHHAGIKGSYTKVNHWVGISLFAVSMALATIAVIIVTPFPENGLSNLQEVFLFVSVVGSISAGVFGVGMLGLWTTIDYVGDIPDSVITNVERLPLGSRLTVHSMSPLPTKKYFSQVDPVMVWWLNDEIGAVIGVWDNDKEMEL